MYVITYCTNYYSLHAARTTMNIIRFMYGGFRPTILRSDFALIP